MKKGWQKKHFEDCIDSVQYTRKIQRKDFLDDGQFPIVSQEAEFVNGYWDDEADVFKVSTPVVIFGDHTQVLKYVDFDFVLGADGVKILPPRDFLRPKFFFYQLQAANFTSLGYARHYRLLKELEIKYPPLAEQQRIVGLLDEAFEGLATAKANAEKNLQNAHALFESHLQSVFTQRGKGWVGKKLESLGEIRTGKRDANHQVENGPYPFYTCAFGQFKSPTFSFDGPSIILPGNGANVGKVFFHDGKFEAYQRTYVVNELNQAINPRFLYFYFSANWPGWIATKQFGSATNYIVVGDLKAFPVPTPSLPVQEATVEQLESFTEETQRLARLYERKHAALEALKKSLLHQAFTGEL